MKRIPWALIWFRAAAGVGLPLVAWLGGEAAGAVCVGLLATGVLSDIFDGVIARRLGVSTPALRVADSRVDVLFWVGALAAAGLLHPQAFARLWPCAAVLAAMELAGHAISWTRFRRQASPHHLLSKLFGLGLWALLSLTYATGSPQPLLVPVFLLGVVSQLEAWAIMLVLPAWRADVRGLGEALRLRRAS